MSRLDSVIRRLVAQRACLDEAARAIAGVPGPVLELGLGNGRTFDHLRGLLAERDIFVFERRVQAQATCIPDEHHLILGDLRDTLPALPARIGAPAALAHADLGSGDPKSDREVAAFLSEALPSIMHVAGIILSDQELTPPDWLARPLPDGVAEGRYFVYGHQSLFDRR